MSRLLATHDHPHAPKPIAGCGRLFLVCWLLLWLGILPLTLSAQRVQVRVVDATTGMGIADAVLVVSGLGQTASSDLAGWIHIDTLAGGMYDGMIRATGYASRPIRLNLPHESTAQPIEVILSPQVYDLAPFTVAAQLSDEDRDAAASRNAVAPVDQISGDALRDVADSTIGDTLERIAGVTTSSEDGSLSGISIRGAGASQTRVTLDGHTAAGGGGRGATRGARTVGQIPREFLQRVQVTKAPTPDMDADAIGGTVDFQTSRIAGTTQPRTSVTLRSAYNEYAGDFGHRAGITHAQPLPLGSADRRLGLLIGLNTERNKGTVETLNILNQWPLRVSPSTGEPTRVLTRLRAGQRQSASQGYGLMFNSDLQLNRNHQFHLKAMWSENHASSASAFLTTEFIRGTIVDLLPQAAEFRNLQLEKQFVDRRQTSRSSSLVLGSDHTVGEWRFDTAIGYAAASTRAPDSRNATFRTARVFDGGYVLDGGLPEIAVRRQGVVMSPADLADASLYPFVRYDLIDDQAADSELTLRFNATRAWQSAHAKWMVKSGLKSRIRDAYNDRERTMYSPRGAPFSLSDVAAPGQVAVYRDAYAIGPAWSAAALESRFRQYPAAFAADEPSSLLDGFAGDFGVAETIYAAYTMAQRTAGRWTVIGGLRVEHTDSATEGYQATTRLDANRQRIVDVQPIAIASNYTRLFPGVHALYRAGNQWTARASVTRTLQRPDFRDLSPSMRVNLDERRIRSGNPELHPFDAKAVDLGADWMVGPWSAVSLGLFYKRIDDFIVDVEQEVTYLDEPGFVRAMPVNGSPADLLGIESALRLQLGFLPAPWSDLDFTVNYTLTDSRAAYPGAPGVTVMLPDQVRETFSIAARWRLNNWTINLRSHYRGLRLQQLVRPGDDQFTAPVWNHSLSLNYRLNNDVTFACSAAALSAPDGISFLGDPLHLTAARAGSRTFSLQVNIRFGAGTQRRPASS
jgi:TonB-dependent receptor